MDNVKTNEYYLEQIIKDINFIINHVNKLTLIDFEKDEVLTYAICFKFTQISESCKKLTSSLKDRNKDIPWNKIIGLRNMLVHDYGHVKLDIIYDTIVHDLPPLLCSLEEIKIL